MATTARARVVRLGVPLADADRERRIIEEAGGELAMVEFQNEEEYVRAARDADVIINAGGRVPARVIQQLGRCRAIIQNSVGFDVIDVEAATERGIMVANLPDYCIEEVSDHAVTLLLAVARRIPLMQKAVREGAWQRPSSRTHQYVGPVERLSETTLGIVGFGNIGKLVNKKARNLFGRVLAADPYVSPAIATQHGVELVPLDDLLRQSDYVTLHVLLTKETRHLINAERLALMKPTAYLVNTCRGPIVDETALIAALRDGRLAGAGLDVFEEEPISPDHPLAQLDNVICTPHMAVYSRRAMAEWRIQPFYEAARILKGQWPRGLVNKELRNRFTLKEPEA